MKKNTGYIITTVVFVVFLFGLAIANLIYSPDDFSETENRMLATFPKLTADSLFGTFNSIVSGDKSVDDWRAAVKSASDALRAALK